MSEEGLWQHSGLAFDGCCPRSCFTVSVAVPARFLLAATRESQFRMQVPQRSKITTAVPALCLAAEWNASLGERGELLITEEC